MEIAGLVIGILGLAWAVYIWKHPNPTNTDIDKLDNVDKTDGKGRIINQNANKLYNIEEIQNAYFYYGNKRIMKVLGNLPSFPDIFIGRDKFPMYSEFERNYNWVIERLKSIE